MFEVKQLRLPAVALLLTSSLVFLGTTYPIEAMNVSALPLKLPIPTSAPASMPGIASASEELHLLTSRLKEQFLQPGKDEKVLISERIKEDFFRSEVPFGNIIYEEALENGLPPELVAAIVQTESDFRPTLLSPKNAQGLMQLIPSTGALMGATDLLNPVENVRAGTKYLRYLKLRFQDPQMVLAAYNAGESTVRRYGGIPPFTETQNFVNRVSQRHELYQQRVAQRIALGEALRIAFSE